MREEIDLIAVDDGVEVYLEDTGPLDAPAIVVLHGGPGGSSYTLREGLEEYLEGFRVLYLDQRGGGRSPALPEEPGLFTIDALVGDLFHLRDHLGLDSWTLLGHGFGGLLALDYARRSPKTTQRLVLVNPWINFPWLAGQLYRASLGLRGIEEHEIELELEDGTRLLQEAFAEVEPKAAFDKLLFPSQHSRMEYEWMAEGSTVMGADTPGRMFVLNGLWRLDYTPFLLEIQAPCTVLLGALDASSYPEAQTISDLVGGQLEIIEGAGHYPWIDQPQAFAEAIHNALLGIH
ncbi:MAG: proline iminopeptidase [Meiothermus sp.]|uniref:Proline iminopeptidase n=2 Tax=Meiothermus hypogaeus TaxID=884155 RepID=A0A511R5H2_9DEIN|nr:alpha/beta hydrolase [Meiothermus hypogaeus]RIH81023.1 Proline iminopeptidase [Meiothermus hypogaeus]GEM84850.1 proline iminopeptidase [Meiothermus hypogaeus NBRC 106114]GIW37904.1 MAG: proline iminopeptidase [Meiothermus sp.]